MRRSCKATLFRLVGAPSIARQDSEEAKMGTLVFVCPTSGREVFTGLEIDPASFEGLRKVTVRRLRTGLTTPFQERPILSREAEGRLSAARTTATRAAPHSPFPVRLASFPARL